MAQVSIPSRAALSCSRPALVPFIAAYKRCTDFDVAYPVALGFLIVFGTVISLFAIRWIEMEGRWPWNGDCHNEYNLK